MGVKEQSPNGILSKTCQKMSLLYKMTFLISNGTYLWNLLIKIP